MSILVSWKVLDRSEAYAALKTIMQSYEEPQLNRASDISVLCILCSKGIFENCFISLQLLLIACGSPKKCPDFTVFLISLEIIAPILDYC